MFFNMLMLIYISFHINLSQVSIFHSSSPSYLCDFTERCPLSFFLNMGIPVFKPVQPEKKTGGLASCQVSGESPGPELTMGGWLAFFFFFFLRVKSRGVGRGNFVTLIRISRQKAVQSQGVFPVGQPSQINALTHNHNATSTAWGSD